jgi:hypothetical protein
LTDTETAITKLFENLPDIDVLEVKVVAPGTETILLAGTVHRAALTDERRNFSSIRMRLNNLGVRYEIVDTYFEAQQLDVESGGHAG